MSEIDHCDENFSHSGRNLVLLIIFSSHQFFSHHWGHKSNISVKFCLSAHKFKPSIRFFYFLSKFCLFGQSFIVFVVGKFQSAFHYGWPSIIGYRNMFHSKEQPLFVCFMSLNIYWNTQQLTLVHRLSRKINCLVTCCRRSSEIDDRNSRMSCFTSAVLQGCSRSFLSFK